MTCEHPEQLVHEYERGGLTRRQLIDRLMAIGAAAAGLGAIRSASASVDQPTFAAQSIDHIALSVTDIPRSRDWYVKHLGLSVASESNTSCFLDCGDDFLALFKGERGGLHHYSFGIPNYDQQRAAERLRAAGLTPKLRGRRIYFDDPDGIEVQVSQEP